MPENRTAESPFQSRFGGGWISASQYLAENMCDRMARKERTALPAKFWSTSALWKKTFLVQLRFANSLLKLYSVAAIIDGLKHPKGKNVYSLGARFLDPLIKDEQERLDRQAAELAKVVASIPQVEESFPAHASTPRPVFQPQKSQLDKLRSLD